MALVGAALFMGTAPAQAAEHEVQLNDTGTGGCISGITQYGAYPQLKIYDDVIWKNATSLHIDVSNATAKVYDCGPAGHQVSGGNFKLTNNWTASGVKLSSCSISVTDAGCGVSGGKIAKVNYSKSGRNTGSAEYKGGGWNVYASTSGSVEQFVHSASYRLTYGDNASEAGTSNITRR
ncbi:hypothetical protein [Actinoplanes sp. NPDC026623]|uniref:hypothetical protein n=1 Tax=Actinoplanes sp. NPDC026623 TaxID=3155610 RepID=UPI0033F86A80